MDFTLQQVFFRLLALLLIAAIHGVALAGAAKLLGDPGPQQDGRLSLNPFEHLDFVGGIGVVLFGFGWIKPVALDPTALRSGRNALVLVALLGLVATLVFAAVLAELRGPLALLASGNLPLHGVAFLDITSKLSVAFVVFNLIPVPPLTGGYVLRALLPGRDGILRRYQPAFVVMLAAFVLSGFAERLLAPILRASTRLLLGT